MVRWLPAIVLLSCSEYDLAAQGEVTPNPPGPRQDHDPDADSAEVVDTSDSDSGGGELPGEEVPEGKVDVVLVIDVAYWYDCYHADLALNTTALVDALLDSGADVAIAIVGFDDYYVDGEWYTAWDGHPYTFGTQVTTDRGRLHAVASGLELAWGGDGPGDGYEALRQAAAGTGYDQDCDGKNDTTTDIAPFRKSGGDAFGGKVAGLYDSAVVGTGDEGGIGLRKNSKRVFVIATENGIREAKYGDEMPKGACPDGATKGDAVTALQAVDAQLLGINAYEFWDIDTKPQEQLEAMATTLGSKIDKDGDGKQNDLAVYGQDWNWPATSVIVDAIWQLAEK